MNVLPQPTAPGQPAVESTIPVPGQFSETEKIRCTLMALALGRATLTVPEVFAALDPLLPAVKRSRKMGVGRNNYETRSTPLPKLIIEGRQLEDAGLRIGKMVSIRFAKNLVLITVDDTGPDPKIDERYHEIHKSRQTMWDIDDKMMYGYPLRVLQEYAQQLDKAEAPKATQPAG